MNETNYLFEGLAITATRARRRSKSIRIGRRFGLPSLQRVSLRLSERERGRLDRDGLAGSPSRFVPLSSSQLAALASDAMGVRGMLLEDDALGEALAWPIPFLDLFFDSLLSGKKPHLLKARAA